LLDPNVFCSIKWWFIRLPCISIDFLCHNNLVYVRFSGLVVINIVSKDLRCNRRQRLW
jgi:hypothetical protein